MVLAGACGTGMGSTQSGPTTYVFAASSLTDALGQAANTFQAAHPGVKIGLNFAGSQSLRTQIEQGAPADVFISASGTDMNTLVQEGYVTPNAARILLTNSLVVIVPAQNPAAIRALQDLERPQIKMVLAAADVPVGAYARQSLQKMDSDFGSGFAQKVFANVVSNEDNVKQVVAKVQLAEADAGIVYVSDAVAAPSLMRIEIPAKWNVIAQYPVAALTRSPNPVLAEQFIDFLLSPAGQSILQKWGFGPAG